MSPLPGQPHKMVMRTRLVFQHGIKNAEDALNIAIDTLEKDGYQITQIMNITHNNSPLDDDWKVMIFGAKEQDDLIEKPNVIVNTNLRDRN